MKVLTVFAHPGSQSFCHAVLERFVGLNPEGTQGGPMVRESRRSRFVTRQATQAPTVRMP